LPSLRCRVTLDGWVGFPIGYGVVAGFNHDENKLQQYYM
jgi:hypothetical protein